MAVEQNIFDDLDYGSPLDPLVLDISDLALEFCELSELITEAFADFKPEIHEKMLAMITDALDREDYNDILLAVLIHEEMSEDYDVWVESTEWEKCLTECLNYYESEEQYEECIKAKNVMERLNNLNE